MKNLTLGEITSIFFGIFYIITLIILPVMFGLMDNVFLITLFLVSLCSLVFVMPTIFIWLNKNTYMWYSKQPLKNIFY